MDKIKKRHLAWAALTLALAACTQNELADNNRLPEGEYPVVIRATGLSVEATPQAAPSTRATVDGDWDGVASVALSLGDETKEYNVTTTDAEKKTATLSNNLSPFWDEPQRYHRQRLVAIRPDQHLADARRGGEGRPKHASRLPKQ